MEAFIFVLTLLLSGYFSGSETAYVASNRLRYQARKQENKGIDHTLFLLADSQRFLTTTLVGNNIVMVACSSIAVVLFSPYISESLMVLVTSVSLLIFGEILPKLVAQQMPNRLTRISAPLMVVFYILFYPLNKIAGWMSQAAVNLLRGSHSEVNNFMKKQDLLILVRDYISSQTLSTHDRKLISRAIKIGDIRVSDIMVPRTDIAGIEDDTPVQEVYDLFIKTGYSRFPVYHQDMDNILGFLYYHDLLQPVTEIKSLVHDALVIPETAKAIHAMNMLKREGKSIALIIDEHGGTAGIITLENVVEQVFGSIYDEFDTHSSRIRAFNESTIVASGRTEVEDLIEQHKLPIPRGDYVTISGYLQDVLGYIPKTGDKVRLPFAVITILKADDTKITDVKIEKLTSPERLKK